MRYQHTTMTFRSLAIGCLAAAAFAGPAAAIQEVRLGARAPSFAAGGAPQMGFDPTALPGITAPQSFDLGSGAARRDPATWAFSGGETAHVGSLFLNTQSGPNFLMSRPGDLGFSPLASFGRGPFDMGFTTRSTAGVLAAENLMFYTSVGRTTWNTIGSAAPVAPGLQLLETPSQRVDMRAGFKAEIMPGLTFGLEAGFAAPAR
jgi:hypothetical protein